MHVKRTNPEWRALYLQYLHSTAWAEKRALVLKRANHLCESCLTTKATEVHHTVYPQVKSGALTLLHFVRQPAWQLRALCTPCHQHETAVRK